MTQQRVRFLDIYRFLAMIFVMWGHLVGTGMYATEIPGIIAGAMPTPIIDAAGNQLGILENFLYYRLHTQTAVMGVIMFFMCTGYFVPAMLERYRRSEFIVNRLCRIFPTLFVSVGLWGVTVFLSQKITFRPSQYLTSITLTYQVFGIAPFMGILWTLVIEVLFYLVAAAAGQVNKNTIVSIYILIAITGLIYREFPNSHTYNLFYNLEYVSFILLGATLHCAFHDRKSTIVGQFAPVGSALFANLVLFQMNRDILQDSTTYPNLFSHLIPLFLFLILAFLEKSAPNFYEKIPAAVYQLSHLVFPVYTTHVCVGLTSMYWASTWGFNRYITVLIGFLMSFLVGKAIAAAIEVPSIVWSKKAISAMRDKPRPASE